MKICHDEVINRDYIYYSPSDIIFQREHIIFAIEHFDVLAENKYPSEPSQGLSISVLNVITPSWNHPLNIKGEIEKRLETVNNDAKEALLHEIQKIGIIYYEYLSPPAQRALRYLEGWKRKKINFAHWKASEEYRKRKALDDKYITNGLTSTLDCAINTG